LDDAGKSLEIGVLLKVSRLRRRFGMNDVKMLILRLHERDARSTFHISFVICSESEKRGPK
jgi:hypothetical protein